MNSGIFLWCGRQLGLSRIYPWQLAILLKNGTTPLRECSRTSNPCFTLSRFVTTTQQSCYSNSEATQTSSGSGQRGSGRTGPSSEAVRRAKLFQIATGAACAFFGASYILYRQLKVQASEVATSEVCCAWGCLVSIPLACLLLSPLPPTSLPPSSPPSLDMCTHTLTCALLSH